MFRTTTTSDLKKVVFYTTIDTKIYLHNYTTNKCIEICFQMARIWNTTLKNIEYKSTT